jgi:CPA1 family monovalent cation:H+ antiporter
VTSLGYSKLLMLSSRDFHALLDRDENLRERIQVVAKQRLRAIEVWKQFSQQSAAAPAPAPVPAPSSAQAAEAAEAAGAGSPDEAEDMQAARELRGESSGADGAAAGGVLGTPEPAPR